jgi:acyl-CoA dehydrogenase
MTEFSTDPAVFETEFLAWLEANAPKSLWHTVSTPFQGHWGGREGGFPSEDHRLWFERCSALGWTAPTWPTEYGGGGMSADCYRIFRQALMDRGLPLPLVGFGLTMIGPILLAEGNEEQKAWHLPKIVRGDIRWCQGYSEPDAGSDLANLRCKAVLDGDQYVVDGQKIWTSHAELSDWIFCLVRTNSEGRKQGGITFLLIDMKTPGITVRPIELISGSSPFCEVFLEGVRVPASHVVGQVDNGWGVAKALLAHERSMVGESVAAGGARPEILHGYTLAGHAKERVGLDGEGVLRDPLLRDAIATNEMEQEAMKLLVRRINDRIRSGAHPGPESSILKLIGTELNQARWQIAVDILGMDGLGWSGDGFSERDQALTRHLFRSRGNTIEGGSSEVQRNIVARRVLGLPKGA